MRNKLWRTSSRPSRRRTLPTKLHLKLHRLDCFRSVSPIRWAHRSSRTTNNNNNPPLTINSKSSNRFRYCNNKPSNNKLSRAINNRRRCNSKEARSSSKTTSRAIEVRPWIQSSRTAPTTMRRPRRLLLRNSRRMSFRIFLMSIFARSSKTIQLNSHKIIKHWKARTLQRRTSSISKRRRFSLLNQLQRLFKAASLTSWAFATCWPRSWTTRKAVEVWMPLLWFNNSSPTITLLQQTCHPQQPLTITQII